MAVNLTADTARCAYRIFKDNGAYGIAINVADDTAAVWSDASNYNLYVNGTANISSNLNVGGTISGASFTPTNPLAVEYGGTGATTAANARTNLGITPANIGAKATQTAVSDPAYDGESLTFIDTISQNIQGVITATKKAVKPATDTLYGVITTTTQTFAGAKTFNNIITSTYAGNGFQLKHGTASKDCYFYAERTDTGTKVGIGVGSGGINHGVYSFTVGTWMVYANASTIFANIQTFNKEATFATNVTVTGSIDIQTAWGYLRWKKSIGNKDISALISANNATTTAPARFWFYQYILDSSGNHITNDVYERFSLPAVTTTRTASKDFNILTDKSAVTIGQGGTGATTATEAWTALGGGASGKHADSYFALAAHNHAAGDITSGTLGLARGGTGKTTAAAAANAFLNSLPTWTTTALDTTYFIRQDTSGTENFGRVQASTLFDYMKGKFGTAATHAHGDYVQTTGDQSVAGQKTFTGVIVPQNTVKIQNSSSPGIQFHANASGLQYYGNMFFNYAATSTYRRPHSFYFREFTYNSTTGVVDTSKFEDYHLPVVSADRTAVATYDIWTTKNYYATSSTALTYVTNSHCDATNLGYLRVDRSGRIAVLTTTTALYLKAYSSSAWIQVGTVPAGYRPAAQVTVRVPLSSGNYMVRVTTGGALQIYKSTNETSNAYFSIPWRIA